MQKLAPDEQDKYVRINSGWLTKSEMRSSMLRGSSLFGYKKAAAGHTYTNVGRVTLCRSEPLRSWLIRPSRMEPCFSSSTSFSKSSDDMSPESLFFLEGVVSEAYRKVFSPHPPKRKLLIKIKQRTMLLRPACGSTWIGKCASYTTLRGGWVSHKTLFADHSSHKTLIGRYSPVARTPIRGCAASYSTSIGRCTSYETFIGDLAPFGKTLIGNMQYKSSPHPGTVFIRHFSARPGRNLIPKTGQEEPDLLDEFQVEWVLCVSIDPS